MTSTATARQSAVALTERVTATQVNTPASSGYMLKATADWDWRDLRDYVVAQIEAKQGPQPRDSKKEYGIFNRFATVYGDVSGFIARYAFEVHDGSWKGAPISVTRFCKASDQWFAEPILDLIADSDWSPAATVA